MKNRFNKISRILIVAFAVLSLSLAPAIQAFQIADAVSRMSQNCSCCCCLDKAKEHQCADITLKKLDKCPCSVDSQQPVNTSPIVSTNSDTNQNKIGAELTYEAAPILAKAVKTDFVLDIDYPPQKRPPLFILNTSLLI